MDNTPRSIPVICPGPLQKCLASPESSGIDIIVALVMKDIDSKSEEDDVDIKSYMKLKVCVLFVSAGLSLAVWW